MTTEEKQDLDFIEGMNELFEKIEPNAKVSFYDDEEAVIEYKPFEFGFLFFNTFPFKRKDNESFLRAYESYLECKRKINQLNDICRELTADSLTVPISDFDDIIKAIQESVKDPNKSFNSILDKIALHYEN